jgi:glycogen phosphorylase
MSKNTRVNKPRSAPSGTDIVGFDSLAEQALDLRSSWNHATDTVWRQVDFAPWDFCGAAVPFDEARILWQR